jgi:hypothetical protein
MSHDAAMISQIDARHRKQRLRGYMRWSRWLMAYLPSAMIIFGVSALFAHSYVGFLLIFVALIVLLAGFITAALGVLNVRCWNCNERFLSVIYPTWPFQSWCAHCSTRADEPDECPLPTNAGHPITTELVHAA